MTLVTELDLPAFDYFDPDLRGRALPRRDARAARARVAGAQRRSATFVLDREAGEFFLRSRAATFPGMKIAELFGDRRTGPLDEEMRRNILHINGADHARLRSLVNPAFTPRAAER